MPAQTHLSNEFRLQSQNLPINQFLEYTDSDNFELEEKVIDNISYFLVNNKINLPGKTKLNSDLELIQMFDHQNKPIFVDKKRLLFYRKDCSSNKRIRKKKILNRKFLI